MSYAALPTGFLWVGNSLALDFINTEEMEQGVKQDRLAAWADLAAWLEEAHARYPDVAIATVVEPAAQVQTLAAARDLRRAMRSLVDGRLQGESGHEPVAVLNEILAADLRHKVLQAEGDGFTCRWTSVGADPRRALVPIAEAFVEILCRGDAQLIRKCEHPDCILFFYDQSKNHARRWCSMSTCGNRVKAAKHRRRGVDQG